MFFMKSTTLVTVLAVFTSFVLASPLDRRAANLEIVLRETQKNTANWHFGLVVRPQGTTSASTTLEHVIDTAAKCMVYDDSRRTTVSATQAAVTAPLIAANGETTNEQLNTAVQNIAKAVPAASKDSINGGDFNNCFDFATETVRRLGTAGYLSAADAEKFVAYHTAHSAAVKAKTDSTTQNYCARDPSGKACNTKPNSNTKSNTNSNSKSNSKSTTNKSSKPATKVTKPKVTKPKSHRSEDSDEFELDVADYE